MSPKACQVSPDNDCPFQETLGRIEKKLDAVHDRLFIDNGKPSIQTEIDRLKGNHIRQKAYLAWFSGVAGGMLAIVVADLISRHIH